MVTQSLGLPHGPRGSPHPVHTFVNNPHINSSWPTLTWVCWPCWANGEHRFRDSLQLCFLGACLGSGLPPRSQQLSGAPAAAQMVRPTPNLGLKVQNPPSGPCVSCPVGRPNGKRSQQQFCWQNSYEQKLLLHFRTQFSLLDQAFIPTEGKLSLEES